MTDTDGDTGKKKYGDADAPSTDGDPTTSGTHCNSVSGLLPPASTTDVVTIQLPTMKYDGGGSVKLFEFAKLGFPTELDDHFFFRTDPSTTGDSNVQGRWKLLGGVFHTGHAPDGGHYISIVRERNKWLMCDDDRVTGYASFEVRHWSGVCLVLSHHVMMNASLITV